MTSSPSTDLPEILNAKAKDGVRFGKELLRKDFMIDEKYRNLNHGSFGTYPRSVRAALRSFQDQAEAQPDVFIRYKYPELLDESREALSKILNVPTAELVFVSNATLGINTILRSLIYDDGDHILYFAPIYGACEKTIAYLTETTPVRSAKVEYIYPVEDDWLVEAFKRKVQEVTASGGRVKVALFETIVSMPGVRFPFEALVQACRELGILSCVDGAHGVGHIELDLSSLDADFFVSNCHKWLHNPRGCATLHIPLRNQHLIRSTLPTSHGFVPRGSDHAINNPLPRSRTPQSAFVTNFQFVGTLDNAPYLCIPWALAFRARLGGEKVVREYCQTLALHGTRRVAAMLGTQVLDNATESLTRCSMANVLLPLDPRRMREIAGNAGVEEGAVGILVRDWISQTLVREYATFMAPMFYGGRWWVRLSGQVYLEMEDFEWAGRTLRELCERAAKGEWAKVKSVL